MRKVSCTKKFWTFGNKRRFFVWKADKKVLSYLILWTDRETDRDTGRKTDRDPSRWKGSVLCIWMSRHNVRLENHCHHRQTNTYTDRHKDRKTVRHVSHLLEGGTLCRCIPRHDVRSDSQHQHSHIADRQKTSQLRKKTC